MSEARLGKIEDALGGIRDAMHSNQLEQRDREDDNRRAVVDAIGGVETQFVELSATFSAHVKEDRRDFDRLGDQVAETKTFVDQAAKAAAELAVASVAIPVAAKGGRGGLLALLFGGIGAGGIGAGGLNWAAIKVFLFGPES